MAYYCFATKGIFKNNSIIVLSAMWSAYNLDILLKQKEILIFASILKIDELKIKLCKMNIQEFEKYFSHEKEKKLQLSYKNNTLTSWPNIAVSKFNNNSGLKPEGEASDSDPELLCRADTFLEDFSPRCIESSSS